MRGGHWRYHDPAYLLQKKEVIPVSGTNQFRRGLLAVCSDLDVLVVARNAKDKNALLLSAATSNSDFMKHFGMRCSPIVFTLTEVKRRLQKKDRLVENILKDGLDLLPIRLEMVTP